jgi:hypothetical protein
MVDMTLDREKMSVLEIRKAKEGEEEEYPVQL